MHIVVRDNETNYVNAPLAVQCDCAGSDEGCDAHPVDLLVFAPADIELRYAELLASILDMSDAEVAALRLDDRCSKCNCLAIVHVADHAADDTYAGQYCPVHKETCS